MRVVRRTDSTSRRSWRQNLAQGEASAASGTLGSDSILHQARSRITLWRAPRAALRFTSFRYACPGLNSVAGFAGSLSLVLLSLTIACAKKEPQNKTAGAAPPSASAENYPNLAIQARELSEAFGRKDYARFVDLIHPKVIEMAGGRERMIAEMTKELKQMEDEGVVVLSTTCGEPTQFLRDGSATLYAVLPLTLKTRAQAGVFQTESSMIAVSSDGGANWKFIDASGKDQGELKKLIPGAADKLILPPDKPAV